MPDSWSRLQAWSENFRYKPQEEGTLSISSLSCTRIVSNGLFITPREFLVQVSFLLMASRWRKKPWVSEIVWRKTTKTKYKLALKVTIFVGIGRDL
mmetsp:Transcript_31923/g.47121  ORF Transcript_31923/g.47121 Transcript_31923/m.47121 type:complete len:96 (+) Transcript_31923:227-514(+)